MIINRKHFSIQVVFWVSIAVSGCLNAGGFHLDIEQLRWSSREYHIELPGIKRVLDLKISEDSKGALSTLKVLIGESEFMLDVDEFNNIAFASEPDIVIFPKSSIVEITIEYGISRKLKTLSDEDCISACEDFFRPLLRIKIDSKNEILVDDFSIADQIKKLGLEKFN
ncbi:MAG: hypothetical protein ACRBCS_01665 [Cellvibrionaceae bacterium]